MAFLLDLIVLAILGLLFPYIFCPMEINERVMKTLERGSRLWAWILSIGWWQAAVPLYCNMWRIRALENIPLAFGIALIGAVLGTLVFYWFMRNKYVYLLFPVLLLIFFVIDVVLAPIIALIGYIAGDKLLPFGGMPADGIGGTYFMWNSFLNMVGVELVGKATVKTIVTDPWNAGFMWNIFAIMLFAIYPIITYGFSKLTRGHWKKFLKE